MSLHIVYSDSFVPIDLHFIGALYRNKWSNQLSDSNAHRLTLLFTPYRTLTSEAKPLLGKLAYTKGAAPGLVAKPLDLMERAQTIDFRKILLLPENAESFF